MLLAWVRKDIRWPFGPSDVLRKIYGFGLLDWRDGWFDGRVAAGRTADVFCQQIRAAVAHNDEDK